MTKIRLPMPVKGHESLKYTYKNFIWDLRMDRARALEHDLDEREFHRELEFRARYYDFYKTAQVLNNDFQNGIERDFKNPPSYSDPKIKAKDWSDNLPNILEDGEEWNKGRRATHHPEIKYECDDRGMPMNPYTQYGIRDRGRIGRYGPNHAVDTGLLRVMPNENGELRLHALGIVRGDNNKPALCGGFIEFERDRQANTYNLDQKTIVTTQAHEIFEELISGSVDLLPAFAGGLQEEIESTINRLETNNGVALSDGDIDTLTRQLTTQRKLRQVQSMDPQFLRRLKESLLDAHDCYKGPVLSSTRNTNTSWMETHLSWINLTEGKWAAIKGHSQWFNYQFKAGDDAVAVKWHEITPDFITKASASHSSFFVYLLQSYMVNEAIKRPEEYKALREQATELSHFIQSELTKPEVEQLMWDVNNEASGFGQLKGKKPSWTSNSPYL